MRRVALVALAGWSLVGWSLLGCGDPEPTAPSPAAREQLEEGVVAEVGSERISAATVGRIAVLRGIDRRAALEAAIQDATFAAGARADLGAGRIASAERRVLAHALLRDLWLDAKDEPVTDAELDEVTQVRWTRYARPTGYRTVHVVVQVSEDDKTEELEQRAKEHAERLREALLPIAERARREPGPELDEEAMFRPLAEHPDEIVAAWKDVVDGIDHGGLDVLPQPLPPITDEGRPINHGNPQDPSRFDEEFTRRVSELKDRGDLTGVFRSYAGYHVAMLLEITPPRQIDRDGRLAELRADILRVRGLRARRALVQRLRESAAIERPMNFEALLSLVRVEPDDG